MLAGFFFLITVLIIGAFSWQAAPESWKVTVHAWFSKTMPIIARWTSKGWQAIKATSRYIKRPETRIYTIPVVVFLLFVWLGAEVHPFNTGSVLEALYHPQSLVGIVAFVIWRSAKGAKLKPSYIRNIGGVALLWTCLWYLLYFVRLDPPNFYNGIYDGLLTIATIPLIFGALAALIARRNTEAADTKRIVSRTILIAAVTWTALGPLANYIKYDYLPAVSERDLQEIRRHSTPTNRELVDLGCKRDIQAERNPLYLRIYKDKFSYLNCTFTEYQANPWLRIDFRILTVRYIREEDQLYVESTFPGSW